MPKWSALFLEGMLETNREAAVDVPTIRSYDTENCASSVILCGLVRLE